MDIVHFKVILKRPDNTQEVRRFCMHDVLASSSFVSLQQKLQILFPELIEGQFRIYWKDSEDDVVIKSEEELLTAFVLLPNDVKKIYVDWKENGPQGEGSKELHRGVTCDECGSAVLGFRYKCLQCPNYDLCEKCESKRLHSSHMVLRIPKELPRKGFHNCWSKLFGSVDYMTKESARHSGKDNSEKCGRRCSGKHRRSCNCEEKDTDEEGRSFKEKRGGTDAGMRDEDVSVPTSKLYSSRLATRCARPDMQQIRTLSHDVEEAVFNTVKFFVDALRDGFTPKTRSEKTGGECCQENATTETKTENEKAKEKEEEAKKEKDRKLAAMTKEAQMKLEELMRKKSEKNTAEKISEPLPEPSAPLAEKPPEYENSGNLYPSFPMDPKIEEALRGMLAMGFSNEGGTLQKMLEEMDGDIMKVLECIDSSL